MCACSVVGISRKAGTIKLKVPTSPESCRNEDSEGVGGWEEARPHRHVVLASASLQLQ